MAISRLSPISSRLAATLGMFSLIYAGCAPGPPPSTVANQPVTSAATVSLAAAQSGAATKPKSELELYHANAAKLHALMRRSTKLEIRSIDHRTYYRDEPGEYETDLVAIMNGSTKPFDFTTDHGLRKLSDGVYGASVLYQVEVRPREFGEWVHYPIGWCFTGLVFTNSRLMPGECAVFVIAAPQRCDEYRVGLSLPADGKPRAATMIWSEAIECGMGR